MTKEKAFERLMELYPQGYKFKDFFHRIIDEFVGEGNVLDAECFNNIVTYLNKMT